MSSGRPLQLAGWLFADLMLVLFLVGFAANELSPPPPEAAAATAGPSASVSAFASPSPSPSPPAKQGLSLEPKKYAIQTNGLQTQADADAFLAALSANLRTDRLDNRRAGLLLTFGAISPPNEGTNLATRANTIMINGLETFRDAQSRNYWDGKAPRGTVTVEIFFFSAS